jgi:hypothetical protein
MRNLVRNLKIVNIFEEKKFQQIISKINKYCLSKFLCTKFSLQD